MNEPVIIARKLTRFYGPPNNLVQALSAVEFEINQNEFVGIFGPSGGGKSTLLNILGLCDRPSEGELLLQGLTIPFDNEDVLVRLRREHIGYVFQYFHLLPDLTALENIVLPNLLKGNSRSSAEKLAIELLGRTGLVKRMHHYPRELSGGEMQRVAVCRAVINRPAIILADEPTGNLDRKNGSEIIALLKEVSNEGSSVVMASHSPSALAKCDRLIHLVDGSIQSNDRPGPQSTLSEL